MVRFRVLKKEVKYDITEDYEDYKGEKWFYKTLGKSHTLDMYVSSSEEEKTTKVMIHLYMMITNIYHYLKIPCQQFFIH